MPGATSVIPLPKGLLDLELLLRNNGISPITMSDILLPEEALDKLQFQKENSG